MRTIPLNYNVLEFESVNYFYLPLPLDRRERVRLPFQLSLQCINVISVHMRISKLDYEFACLGIGDVCDHMCEERIGRDVEGNSESEVSGSLEHETREPRFLTWFPRKVYIELAHHMTGW